MAETSRWLTIPEIVDTAREKLPAHIWDFACGGAESEVTTRRNRTAFEYLGFRTRVLRDVRQRDMSTTVLGHRLASPVMLAPIGSMAYFDPDGALACARVAERAGTAAFVGVLSTPDLETVRAGSSAPLVFQLQPKGGRAHVAALVERAERAGHQGICLTADSVGYGRRERDLHNRLGRGALATPNLRDDPPADPNAVLTWDDMGWLTSLTPLPVLIKGIMCAEDARLAVEHGAAAVYVSNHGGRQLDHGAATIEVLPEVVEAVAGRAEVLVDGGFMRGTDVLKAIALGARAVLIGRLMAWGLAAGGDEGLLRVLELLAAEMDVAMINLGVRSLAELSPDCLRHTVPPLPAPWPTAL